MGREAGEMAGGGGEARRRRAARGGGGEKHGGGELRGRGAVVRAGALQEGALQAGAARAGGFPAGGECGRRRRGRWEEEGARELEEMASARPGRVALRIRYSKADGNAVGVAIFFFGIFNFFGIFKFF